MDADRLDSEAGSVANPLEGGAPQPRDHVLRQTPRCGDEEHREEDGRGQQHCARDRFARRKEDDRDHQRGFSGLDPAADERAARFDELVIACVEQGLVPEPLRRT